MIFLILELYFSALTNPLTNLILLKNIFLILILFLIACTARAQNISVPKLALNGIEFSVKIENLPDTLKTVKLHIVNDDYEMIRPLNITKGKVDTTLTINQTGNFECHLIGFKSSSTSIRVVPGILSLLPPLIAILLALIFRQVIISLMVGVYIGAVFIYDYNPFIGILRLIDTYIINALSDYSHIQIVVFTFLFGGLIGLISKSGGTRGIANLMIRFAKKRKSGLIATWLSGLNYFL